MAMLLSVRLRGILHRRAASAWIASTSKRNELPEVGDVEKRFIDKEVQALLYELTGLDMHGKVFRERNISKQERSHYALMTDRMFEEAVKRKEEQARKFLQFVPLKEPREDTFTVLSTDSDIADFDIAKFVFTDITFDATDRDRLVVVREPDGVLRTALPEEHDRMNRVYYEQPDRPVQKPKIFSDPHLQNALDADKHEFILDWACYYFQPDDSEFVKLCCKVFDETIAQNKFELLRSTRHFGTLVFYMVLNNNVPPLLRYFSSLESASKVNDVSNAIRLYRTVYRTWKTAVSDTDSDEKVVQDFLKQNPNVKRAVPDLLRLMKNDYTDEAPKQKQKQHSNPRPRSSDKQ